MELKEVHQIAEKFRKAERNLESTDSIGRNMDVEMERL